MSKISNFVDSIFELSDKNNSWDLILELIEEEGLDEDDFETWGQSIEVFFDGNGLNTVEISFNPERSKIEQISIISKK
jgi:hypothetical protein